MNQDDSPSRNRYDTTGNPEAEYVDAAQTVMRNKLGITSLPDLQLWEERALTAAYERLAQEVRVDTPMTCELLRHIHQCIFGELFDWAGRWRTVWISKPGVTWPPPDFLDQNMTAFERDVLAKYPPNILGDDDAFCRAIGEIQGEFLVIHPFREGNARTVKLMSDLLASQTGRPLLAYDQSQQGMERYVTAAKAAFRKDYAPMTAIIRQALSEAQKT